MQQQITLKLLPAEAASEQAVKEYISQATGKNIVLPLPVFISIKNHWTPAVNRYGSILRLMPLLMNRLRNG